MNFEQALVQLRDRGNAQKAAEMAQYHKAEREYLGVSNPEIDALTKAWRADLNLDDRLELARSLWNSNLHEARVAAAKLLTQARIRPDDTGAWRLIASWVPDFDAWAIADHASIAGQKRLVADPSRLDEVETWTESPHLWTRRAALVMTLPWAKLNNPKPHELEQRERIIGWAQSYVGDQTWFIQKAIAWWMRDLSKRAPDRVVEFIEENGPQMKAFARKEAMRLINKG